MKKILLTAMAICVLASSSAFGMYGADSTWLFFLIHGNQFRARMNQLGFTLGNGTIKGTFGFKSNLFNTWGRILDTKRTGELEATISGGIGYTGNGWGIGLGYNYTMSQYTYADNSGKNGKIDAHTPVITLNAVNNNLRIAVPISISSKDDLGDGRTKYFGMHIPAQIRFYTGVDAFNYIRFEFNYGQNSYTSAAGEKLASSYVGFHLRLHFLNTVMDNVIINPFLRVDYNGALDKNGLGLSGFDGHGLGTLSSWSVATLTKDKFARNPYEFRIAPSLSLTVNTDIVSFILEPGIGYQAYESGVAGEKLEHRLYWNAYGEVYIRPTPNFEWYFEMDVNNNVPKIQTQSGLPIAFGANSGITWYLPSLRPNAQ